MMDKFQHDIADDVRCLLEAYPSYFKLSDEEITNFATLVTEGAEQPEEPAIERVARLAATTNDEVAFFTAIYCQWGYCCRNSIKNNEDVDRKNRLRAIFTSICPPRNEIKNNDLFYCDFVKYVLSETSDREIAAILAFGLYLEMDSDDLFWSDLWADLHSDY